MVLPEPFTTVAPSIKSFDFRDIASGTGIIEFFAGNTVDKNILSDNSFYSKDIFQSSGNMAVSSDQIRLDIDFDVLMNATTTIEGTIVVNVPIAARRSGATTTAHVVIKLRKWDGTTETEIASNTSSVLSNNSAGVKYLMTATDLTIPRTTINVGETLRLTIELWGSGEATPSSVEFAHDPKNRTTGWDTTVPSILTLQLPVRIEE